MEMTFDPPNYITASTDTLEIRLEIWPDIESDSVPTQLEQGIEELMRTTPPFVGAFGPLGKVVADGVEYHVDVDNVGLIDEETTPPEMTEEEKAQTLVNFFEKYGENSRTYLALWYEDGIVFTASVSEQTRDEITEHLRMLGTAVATGNDGLLSCWIIRAKPDKFFDVMEYLKEKAGDDLMFQDNRMRDSNTIDGFARYLKRTY